VTRVRRHARPRIRQRTGRAGGRLYVFELRCACGWTRLVAGRQTALAVADAHWHQAHRCADRGRRA
jgi:hypothetical protein